MRWSVCSRALYFPVISAELRGVIVGQFTEYGPDLNHEDMEEMVSRLLSRHGLDGIPVAYRFPVGHVVGNYPMIEGHKWNCGWVRIWWNFIL